VNANAEGEMPVVLAIDPNFIWLVVDFRIRDFPEPNTRTNPFPGRDF